MFVNGLTTMLEIGRYRFSSRLLLGTGKFASNDIMRRAIIASGSELVTVALKRVDVHSGSDGVLESVHVPGVHLLPNTSGVRTAKEAIFAAEMAREALGTDLLKLEIHPDPRYLLPDGEATLEAARVLVKEGFTVLPYVQADPVLCKKLEEVGVAAVMPLGSPIGSNRGVQTRDFVKIIAEQANVPVIVDAGIGSPADAAEAIELGASGVLVNTAVAVAGNPAEMALAFRRAVEGAVIGVQAGLPPRGGGIAVGTSPLTDFFDVVE